jgi:hypothetical protein
MRPVPLMDAQLLTVGFIFPGLHHDMHDESVSEDDTWL